MKILVIHNEYGRFSGEEAAVWSICRLLENHGHEVIRFFRSSATIPFMRLGNVRAFLSGIHSFSSARAMLTVLRKYQPDIAHVHNLFPLISPSVISECRRAKVPVVMTVHNYRLLCPNGRHLTKGKVCEACSSCGEFWCILRNCEQNLFKSIGYALRNYVARKKRVFMDNVTVFCTLTEFQRRKLIKGGFPEDRIVVTPNMMEDDFKDEDVKLGAYVGYVGRICPEKGIDTLMSAAITNGDISFKLAGDYSRMPYLLKLDTSNVDFLGHLNKEKCKEFYKAARMIVLCSECFEGFPVVLLEAMLHGKPVICSRIGGLPEIVDDGITGLLFEPGNTADLADKIRYLWKHTELCVKMGLAGRKKAKQEYNESKFYERLMAVHNKALKT